MRLIFWLCDNLLCYSDIVEILRWKDVGDKAAFHAARQTKTRAKNLRYHGHDFAELFWTDLGPGIHRINDEVVPLPIGTVVLIRPPDCHGMDIPAATEMRVTNIAFPVETMDDLGTRYCPGIAFWHPGKLPATYQVESAQLKRLNRWADDLSQAPRERLYLDRFLLNVLTELTSAQSEAAPDDAPDWLTAACRAIQKRENFSGGVEQFLRLCGRSREHAARSVRQHLGTTPTDYVNRIRIAYAQRQLEMGDQGILDIALDCGIENLSHFYSLFRAQTGVTPRAYRLSHRRAL
jgi:AraC family cel operon transcriptional repressor